MKRISAVLIILIFLSINQNIVLAAKEVVKFEIPNPQEKFCGPVMQAAFCQCAFYNNNCETMKMSQGQAFSFVDNEYKKWVGSLIKKTAEQCKIDNGYWNTVTRQCIRCTDGEVLSGTKCLPPGSESTPKPENQCQTLIDFNSDWKKYSDFDSSISINEASFEVQEYHRILDELVKEISEINALEYDMEINKQIQFYLHEYKQALDANEQKRITNTIFRLAQIAYNLENSHEISISSYLMFLISDPSIKTINNKLQNIKQSILSDDKQLLFGTDNIKEKIKSNSWNATLESIENIVDPKTAATKALDDLYTTDISEPDLTPEEINILIVQHLDNLIVDTVLSQSYAENAKLRQRLLILKKDVADLYTKMEDWRGKEYERVKSKIESSCQK